LENKLRFDTQKAALAQRAASPVRGFLNRKDKDRQRFTYLITVKSLAILATVMEVVMTTGTNPDSMRC
jgi:hypothetical protein